MSAYICQACLREGEDYVEAPAVDSACPRCGKLAPQLERVLAALLQVLQVTPVAELPVDSAMWTVEEAARELGCHPATGKQDRRSEAIPGS